MSAVHLAACKSVNLPFFVDIPHVFCSMKALVHALVMTQLNSFSNQTTY